VQIPDHHVAWTVPLVVVLCAWGLAGITAPLHAKARAVECYVALPSNQFVSVEALGKGYVYE
jgi:hypothetical protein